MMFAIETPTEWFIGRMEYVACALFVGLVLNSGLFELLLCALIVYLRSCVLFRAHIDYMKAYTGRETETNIKWTQSYGLTTDQNVVTGLCVHVRRSDIAVRTLNRNYHTV